jgi:hypothetical protein
VITAQARPRHRRIYRLSTLLSALVGLALLVHGFLVARPTTAATVVLYQNDFEAPRQTVAANCAPDFDATNVNTLFGPEFRQQNTVETVMINGPANVYNDPSGTGGNYALGMLSSIQNDKVALTFDSQGFTFINLRLDISPIDVQGCGGPFGVAAPTFQISLIDSPGGAFAFNSGTVLDTQAITGAAPISQYTFNWTNRDVALDTTGTADGKVTIVFDLTASGYAALDNIVIVASDTAGTSDEDLDGVSDPNDACAGTTLGLAVSAVGCATVAGIVSASASPADGGYDQDDLTGMGLVNIIPANLPLYEAAIATASPAPTTTVELQAIIDRVNNPNGNLTPFANAQTVNGMENSDLLITLSGSDANGDALSYSITSLPLAGTLYQATDAGTRGEPITSVPVAVSSPAHAVIFAPAPDSSGTNYAAFTFVVNDGQVSSADATVTITIASAGPDTSITISAAGTTPQRTSMSYPFKAPLQVVVRDSNGTPVSGAVVQFIAPAQGASGTFAGGHPVAIAITDAAGLATAPQFTANMALGSYDVTATVADGSTFVRANLPLTNTLIFYYNALVGK